MSILEHCKALQRLQISYSKKRPKFRKSATPEEQKVFKIKAQKMIDALTKTGFITVHLDEMTCRRPGGVSARGWHLPEHKEEIVDDFPKITTKVFGVLGKDFLHVKTVNATNSDTFIEFLEELHHKYTKILFILDNASYHKSKMVREYQGSITSGNIKMLFLLPIYSSTEPNRDTMADD